MKKKIAELKRLAASYFAAQEYDYCPEPEQATDVASMLGIDLSEKELTLALEDNQGRRPDEIAGSIIDLINDL